MQLGMQLQQLQMMFMMSQQAQRMQSLVSDLLMLSRLEGSPLPNLQEITSVSALWQVISADARALTGESQAGELPSQPSRTARRCQAPCMLLGYGTPRRMTSM